MKMKLGSLMSLAVSLVLVSACSPGGGGGSGGTSSSGGGGNIEQLLGEMSAAECAFNERCVTTRGRLHTDLTACKTAMSVAAYDKIFRAYFGKSYLQWVEETYNVDNAKAAACTAAFGTMSCDVTRPYDDPACKDIATPKHTAALGQACSDDPTAANAAMCTSDAACMSVASTPGCFTCQAPRANGQDCSSSTDCQSDHCDFSTTPNKCAAASGAGKGQSCEGASCKFHFACAGTSGSRTCQDRVGSGSACQSDGNCFEELSCASGTCKAPLANGATCHRDGSDGACTNWCVFAAKDSPTGTCGNVTTLPGAGQPCVESYSCLAGTRAKMTYDASYHVTSCECAALSAAGEECNYSDTECQTGLFCDYMASRQCKMKKANAATCSDDRECQSGSCATATTQTCVAPAACP